MMRGRVKVQKMPLGMFGPYLGIFRLYREGAEHSCRQQRRQRRDLWYHHLSRFLKYRISFLTQKRYFEYFHLRQLALEQLRVEHYVIMSSPFDVIAIITPKPGKADRVCLDNSTDTISSNKQLMFSRSKNF